MSSNNKIIKNIRAAVKLQMEETLEKSESSSSQDEYNEAMDMVFCYSGQISILDKVLFELENNEIDR